MADYNYDAEATKVERQRRLADVLRKLALQTSTEDSTDPGRMVSGHYVAPSVFQGLNQNVARPYMANQNANRAIAQADQMEGAYNQQVNQARQAWQSSLPQAVAGQELPGPRDELGSPELDVPPQLPTRDAVLKATLAGMQIPGNEKAAGLWNQGMQEEQRREDIQAERRSALQMTMRARMDEQRRQEQFRREQLEETKRRNQEIERQRRSEEATRLAIAAGNDATRLIAAQMAADSRQRAAEAKAGKEGKDDDGLTPAQRAADLRAIYNDLGKIGTKMKPMVPVVGAAKAIQDIIDKHTDPKTGKVGNIPGIGYEAAVPGPIRSLGATVGILDSATNPNKAKVEDLVGAIMRNQAGLSQTISESIRVLNKTLSSGAYSQEEFLDNWHNLVRAINEDQELIQQTHRPEALEMFKKNGGSFEPVKPNVKVTDKAKRLQELRDKARGDW